MKNYYSLIKNKNDIKNPKFSEHGLHVPFYGLIIGPSGSGKTSILLSFIEKSSGTFQRIVICCKNKDEPLYQLLESKVKDIEFFEDGEIPDIDSFREYKSSLIVFDDLVLEPKPVQDKIGLFYITARKVGISCLYLSQSYYRIPKLIRQNARYIFIRKVSTTKDLKLILSEYELNDNLIDLYKESTKEPFDFLLIDTALNKYSHGFFTQ